MRKLKELLPKSKSARNSGSPGQGRRALKNCLVLLIVGWACFVPSMGQAQSAAEYTEYGASLVDAGKYKEALEYLRYALQLDQKSAKGWELLGKVYEGLGDPKNAKQYFDYAAVLRGASSPPPPQKSENKSPPPANKGTDFDANRSISRLDSLIEQNDFSGALDLLKQISGADGLLPQDKRKIALTKYEISKKLLRDAQDTALRYPELHVSDRALRNLAKYGMTHPSRALAKFSVSWVVLSPILHGFDFGFSPIATLNIGFSMGVMPIPEMKYSALEPRIKIYASPDNYSFVLGLGFLMGSLTATEIQSFRDSVTGVWFSREVERKDTWSAINVKIGMAKQKGHFIIEMDWSFGLVNVLDNDVKFAFPALIPGLRIGMVF